MITLRKMKKEDSINIFELVMELAEYEESPHSVKTCPQDFEVNFQNGVFDGFVIEIPEKGVVGMALYFSYFSTWNGYTIYLEDFYIKEAYRGQGLGKLLFEAVLNQAQVLGARMLKWQVLDWNEPAKNFYNKYGSIFVKGWENGVIYLNMKQ